MGDSFSSRLRFAASFVFLLVTFYEFKASYGFEQRRTRLNSAFISGTAKQKVDGRKHRQQNQQPLHSHEQTVLGSSTYPNSESGDGSRDRVSSRSSRLLSPLRSPMEEDRYPRRSGSLIVDHRQDYREEWGVSTESSSTKEFPGTIDAVVHQTFDAIAGTLYATNMLDPNIVRNAANSGMFDYRPTRSQRDAGRMGVEIDGAQKLFPRARRISPEQANRHVSLMLAAKLSRSASWESYEEAQEEDEESNIGNHKNHQSAGSENGPEYRPIAVYFTTVKQALMASQELKLLKRAELSERKDARVGAMNMTTSSGRPSGIQTSFDMISIQCLGDEIPSEMRLDRGERRRYRGLANGHVNATRGLVMIVQPTDYNTEYRPPGPVIGVVGSFQGLVAQASIEELPTVVVSPRFLSNDSPYAGGGWDQSGFQRSATYGGTEPPRGPTPWVMRDFSPPIYCWVNNAGSLANPRHGPGVDPEEVGCYYSRVALTQSVMDKGHAWNIFVARECSDGTRKLPTSYHYVASTRSASGRPTRDVIRRILNEHSSTF